MLPDVAAGGGGDDMATLLSKYCRSRIKYMLIECEKKRKEHTRAQTTVSCRSGLFLCSLLSGVTAAAAAGDDGDVVCGHRSRMSLLLLLLVVVVVVMTWRPLGMVHLEYISI